MKKRTNTKTPVAQSAPKTIFLIILSIFISELIIMTLLYFLPLPHKLDAVLLNPLLLVCVLSPFLFFLVFRPMRRQIHEKSESEKAFHIQKDFTAQLLDNTSAAIFVIDTGHRITYWNHACEELTGIKSGDIIGTTDQWKAFYKEPGPVLADLIIDSGHERPGKDSKHYGASPLIPGGICVEDWFDPFHGRKKYLVLEGAPVYARTGELTAAIETIHDITRHKESEEAFVFISEHIGTSMGEEFFRLLVLNLSKALDSAFAFVAIIDKDDQRTVNTIAVSAHGEIGDNFSYHLDGTPCDNVINKDLCVYPDKVRDKFPEDHMLAEMGLESYAGMPLFDSASRSMGLLVVVDTKPFENVELTSSILKLFAMRASKELERSLKDAELRTRSAQLHSLVNNLQAGIIFEDMDRVVIFTNKTFCDLFGIGDAPSSLIGQDYRIISQTCKNIFNDPAKFLSSMEAAVQNGRIVNNEVLLLNDDRFFERDYIPVSSGEERIGHLWQYRDVTERKQLEMQLLQAQKMDAVGQLAGGIAHDFSNALTAITGYASLLQLKLKENHPLRNYVDNIVMSIDKAASLTRSLLTFSRKQVITLRPVQINTIITRVEKWLTRLIGEDILLRTELCDEDTTVVADSGQLEQVLMNLVTNARDAMSKGGKITITSKREVLDEQTAGQYPERAPGEYVSVSVTDTGKGLDESARGRIFEPFYTTKENGKGTGLGLSIVYGIVTQHHGFVDVVSEPGRFTTITFSLPYSDEVTLDRPFPLQEDNRAGHETILMAEDDPDVRSINREVLEQFGYSVIEAVDGEDALRKYRENRDRVNLLLLDIIMPGMNGNEVYDEIRKTDPYVKALFISGYASNFLNEKGVFPEGTYFIQKPVVPIKLLSKVRDALGSGKG